MPKQIQLKPSHNVAVRVEFRLLEHVVTSAVEAEYGALFHNPQLLVPI